ncbi:glycosyltransferase family 4 protein, partial [Methylobacillus pratensis]
MSPRPGDAARTDAPVDVLHLVNGELYSGLERVVDHLAGGAAAHGFRLRLAFLKPGAMRARMVSAAAAVDLPMRSRFDLGSARAAARLAVETGCALVHSHTVRSALIARRVQRLTGLPWVHHVHSPALHESERRGMNLLNYAAEAVVMRHADAVVAVSDALAAYVARHYRVRADRLAVVPNGVLAGPDPDFERPAGAPATVLSVGWFRPRKGIEHLVDATARLVAGGRDVRLRLAGEFADASYEAVIRARIAGHGLGGRIDCTGFVRDVAAALDACDVFVLPSLYGEGMPMAVLEALARGRPVVASDIDGIRELLAGGAGVLVA